MAKLKDIAERAEVSISTVSRVLKHDGNFSVSFAKRQEILRIAQELQYPSKAPPGTPRAQASISPIPPIRPIQLKGSIALILLYSEIDELEDPYYLAIRTNFRAEALRLGIEVTEYFHPDPSSDIRLGEHPGAVIVGSGRRWTGRFRDRILAAHPSPLLVDFAGDDADVNSDCVLTDFEHLTNAALTHLLQCGFTRIGFIGSREFNRDSRTLIEDERETFFARFLEARGLYRPELVFTDSETTLEAGCRLAEAAVRRPHPPQAVFIETDTMALGAIKAFKNAGLTLPADLSIIGCNDIPEARYLEPALTTMRIHTELMGTAAARMAVEKALYPRRGGLKVIIPNELVIRESCAPRAS